MAGLSLGRRRLPVRSRLTDSFCLAPGEDSFICPQKFSSWRIVVPFLRAVCAAAFLFFFAPLSAAGDAVDGPNSLTAVSADTSEQAPVVRQVVFENADAFPKSRLRGRVRTEPNRRFLGIPGFTWWVWLYQLGDSSALGNRIGQALQSSGEPPARLDTSVVRTDVERLAALYQQEGFRQATVNARIDTLGSPGRVRVAFEIEPGEPTYLRQISYDGLDVLDESQRRRLVDESVIPVNRREEGALAFRTQDQRYSEPLLLEERRRLLTFLRDEGYAAVARDSIRAIVRTATPDSFDVTLQVRPGQRYRFGDVYVDVTGPEPDAPTRQDTLMLGPEPGDGRLIVSIEQERQLSPRLIRRALQFEPTHWYDQSAVLSTKRRLEATGVFALTDISAMSPDNEEEYEQGVLLPQRIQLRTRPRNRVRAESFVLQRSGALGVLDNELGTGLGISYNNANLFGAGEAFQVRLSGSIAGDISRQILTTSQLEASTSLRVPYLLWPFGGLDDRLNLFDARTRLTFSLLTLQSPDLRFAIRGRGSAQVRLELQHTPTVTSLIDIPTVSFSNPDTLSGFESDVLERLIGSADDPVITDPVQRAQVLEDYTQPQFNNALRYTLRSSTVDPLRRQDGYSYEAVAEVGSHIPLLLDRFVLSPDTISSRLPIGTGDGLLYRPYIRIEGDMRQYRPLGSRTVLANRLYMGFGQPTGPSNVMPFDRRFFSGGSASVRGWRLRELGPGSVQSFSEGDTGVTGGTNLFGGDIKLEANVELRHTLIRSFLAADWVGAVFVDAGNVWFGPSNPGFQTDDPDQETGKFRFDSFFEEVAVGTGVGMRLSWEFLVARFDLGWRAFDPATPGREILPSDTRGTLFANPAILHFGIGHTF